MFGALFDFLFLLRSVFGLAAKRLLAQRGFALASALGLISSVAMAISVPLYADAVQYQVQQDEMSRYEVRSGWSLRRLPFVFIFRYMGTWSHALDWEAVEQADTYLSGPVLSTLGLPKRLLVRYFRTDIFRLYANAAPPEAGSLTRVTLGFSSDIEANVTLLEGRFPVVAEPGQPEPIEVLVSEALAGNQKFHTDEVYMARRRYQTDEGESIVEIPVRIVGIWRATEPEGEYWCCSPMTLDNTFIMPEASFHNRVQPALSDEVFMAQWYLLLDGTDVRAGDVPPLLNRIDQARRQAETLLPKSRLDLSPDKKLERYQREAQRLTLQLYAFSIPILGLILAFIGLVIGLVTSQQRNEIAVLRSRGATAVQVTGIAIVESLILGGLALLFGSLAGLGVASLMGRSRSFLDFTFASTLPVRLKMATLEFGAIMIALAWLVRIIYTFNAARHTIVTYKQEQARATRPPWWQRAWLDVLLFLPAVYGGYVLRRQGGLTLPIVGDRASASDPLQDPLLLLVPALGVFALTLFIVRLLPGLMTLLAWLTAWTRDVGILLAARHLARAPGFYTGPLVLLVLTLSLSAFTASVAQTLDHHLKDQTYYAIGADLRVDEWGERGVGDELSAEWQFLPVSEHLKVTGVQAATRVGNYSALARVSNGTRAGRFLGVDRLDFPLAAFWRNDFASESLGSLMNDLALTPEGVLVNRDFLAQTALTVGDPLRLSVDTAGHRITLDAKIVGAFDLFPTWYPEEGALFVGNLDYLFEQAGGNFPYTVWLKTDPQVKASDITQGIWDLGIFVKDSKAARDILLTEQTKPERQGLFGLLSVGFVASGLLTVIGFLLYAVFSYRRRFIELGILRAVGLSSGQMTEFLVAELAGLLLLGGLAGTGLGIGVSHLFIPYLQVGVDQAARLPPFVVEISWTAIFRVYVLFGVLFVAGLAIFSALLLRLKIFQAIKLGETV